MSKKKKLSHAQKMQQRAIRSVEDVDLPPLEAVEAYMETYEWAGKNPDAAAAVQAFTSDEINANVIGIAYPELMPTVTDDEITVVADLIKTWHILNGFKYFYDWWDVPIATMSVEDIIAQIQLDRAEGRIPAPVREPEDTDE